MIELVRIREEARDDKYVPHRNLIAELSTLSQDLTISFIES